MGRGTSLNSTYRALSLLCALCVAGVLLVGCTTAEIPSGVYVATLSNDVALLVGAPAAAPVWSPDGESIAWGTERGILVGKPDGQPPRRLAESPVTGKPAWSPDGTMLAYVDSNMAALAIVDALNGAVRLAVPVANAGATEANALVSIGGPAWSPDGARIAFVCWDGRGDEVCIINADGSDRRQVTHIEPVRRSTSSTAVVSPAGSNVGPPVWSPDGASLAVPAFPEFRGSASGIYVVTVDLGIARRVTALQPTSDLVWTSDGGALIFSASADGRSDVYRVSASGGLARNLTRALPDGGRDPALSPDGLRLAVASGRDIQIIGQPSEKIGASDETMRDRFPAWSPDGTELAFSSTPALVTKYD